MSQENKNSFPPNLKLVWSLVGVSSFSIHSSQIDGDGYISGRRRIEYQARAPGTSQLPEDTYNLFLLAALQLAKVNPDKEIVLTRFDNGNVVGENPNNAPFRADDTGRLTKTIEYGGIVYRRCMGDIGRPHKLNGSIIEPLSDFDMALIGQYKLGSGRETMHYSKQKPRESAEVKVEKVADKTAIGTQSTIELTPAYMVREPIVVTHIQQQKDISPIRTPVKQLSTKTTAITRKHDPSKLKQVLINQKLTSLLFATLIINMGLKTPYKKGKRSHPGYANSVIVYDSGHEKHNIVSKNACLNSRQGFFHRTTNK